ncbi:MAG: PEP-CTERM sorting domain-containing protein [Caldithrix sp.]|nr:MAG: PEP-CTERM sorting domain-containing protein [Caldithrix sp.]
MIRFILSLKIEGKAIKARVSKCTSLFVLSNVLLFLFFLQSSDALFIQGDGSKGDFVGELTYGAISTTTANLIVELTNTSPLDNGGYLTAFVFNNPGNQISNVTLTPTDTDFSLLGDTNFNNGINAMPFGYFDIGASTSNSFQGGGPPSKGIGVGDMGIFTFGLTGTNLDQLTTQSFVNELSSANQFFVARFRGFDDGDSNKTTAETATTPEPSTFFLFGVGILGVLGYSYRRRKKPYLKSL